MREMIFLRWGWPKAFDTYQMILIAVSLASEPELAKKIFDIGTGANSLSISASTTPGSCDLPAKIW